MWYLILMNVRVHIVNLMQSRGEYEDIYKIIVVGDFNTGKTHLIHYYCKGKLPVAVMATIGVEYYSKSVALEDGSVVKMQVWDTAGQEQYRAITINHYRRTIGAVVVFDVTNRQSFNHLADWLHIVREKADLNVQICIVANKIDDSRREVTQNQGITFANKEGVLYMETTIKEPKTINQAFNQLLQKVAVCKKTQHLGIKVENNYQTKNQCGC